MLFRSLRERAWNASSAYWIGRVHQLEVEVGGGRVARVAHSSDHVTDRDALARGDHDAARREVCVQRKGVLSGSDHDVVAGEGYGVVRSSVVADGLECGPRLPHDVHPLTLLHAVDRDLPMAPVDATAWRWFMAGTRGPGVAGLGGIGDTRAQEAARRLMRSDSIFRDSALFFLRRFDSVLSEFCSEASDAQIEDLAGTRSGRAFMLLARLSGSLD